MSILLLLAVLAVMGVIAVAATGRGGALPEAEPDRSPRGELASGPVRRGDVDGLRFSLAFRGYRPSEVDDVLDRLAEELAARDERIAELEHGPADGVAERPRDDDAPVEGRERPDRG